MEQAFIKLKLLVNDAKDIDRYLKELDKQTLKTSKAFFDMNKWRKAGETISKGFSQSTDILSNIGRFIAKGVNSSLETGDSAITKTDENIVGTRSFANLFGTEDMTQADILKRILQASGAKNPFMVAQNFMEKLGEARSGENMFLKDYAGMSNDDALLTLLEDLQEKNFSATDRSKILSEVFGKVYGDNIGMLLGSINVRDFQKDARQVVEGVAKERGLTTTELWDLQQNQSMSRMRRQTIEQQKQDLRVGAMVSDDKFTNSFIEKQINENELERARVARYSESVELNKTLQEGTKTIEKATTGVIKGVQKLNQDINVIGGWLKDTFTRDDKNRIGAK